MTLAVVYSAFGLVQTAQNTTPDEWWKVLPWAIAILVELATMVWAGVMFGVLRVILSIHDNTASAAAQMGRLETLLEDQSNSARKLVDLAALSDEAKSLIYRDREVEAVRETIHTMLVRQDYKAAEDLISGIEKRPTMALDAAVMRQEVETTRQASIEGKIDLAVGRVDEIIGKCDWPRAIREAARMKAAFPNNTKIAALPQRIEASRMKHKRDLLQAYGEAVRKNDVDASIDMLKEARPLPQPPGGRGPAGFRSRRLQGPPPQPGRAVRHPRRREPVERGHRRRR